MEGSETLLQDACACKNDLHFTSVNFPAVANFSAYKKMNKFCGKHKKIAGYKYRKKYFKTYKDCPKKTVVYHKQPIEQEGQKQVFF